MDQRIEAPTESDVSYIAHALVNAGRIVKEITGHELAGSLGDLSLLQKVLSSGSIQREAAYQLQSLGLAFGKVFVNSNPGYDWWMVEDEYGRDPAVRYKETSLLLFPQTMLSKRIEEHGSVEVSELYTGLLESLDEIIKENFAGA